MIKAVKRGAKLRPGVTRFSVGRKSSGTGMGCLPAHALANKFKLKPYGPYTREESIMLYEAWLQEQLTQGNNEVRRDLNRIWLAAKRGDVELECFCHPKPCHAEVIKKLVEEAIYSK